MVYLTLIFIHYWQLDLYTVCTLINITFILNLFDFPLIAMSGKQFFVSIYISIINTDYLHNNVIQKTIFVTHKNSKSWYGWYGAYSLNFLILQFLQIQMHLIVKISTVNFNFQFWYLRWKYLRELVDLKFSDFFTTILVWLWYP